MMWLRGNASGYGNLEWKKERPKKKWINRIEKDMQIAGMCKDFKSGC